MIVSTKAVYHMETMDHSEVNIWTDYCEDMDDKINKTVAKIEFDNSSCSKISYDSSTCICFLCFCSICHKP